MSFFNMVYTFMVTIISSVCIFPNSFSRIFVFILPRFRISDTYISPFTLFNLIISDLAVFAINFTLCHCHGETIILKFFLFHDRVLLSLLLIFRLLPHLLFLCAGLCKFCNLYTHTKYIFPVLYF